MAFSELRKRVTRLEETIGLRKEESLERILARAARLTPEARQARITALEDQLLESSRMEPTLENRVQAVNQVMLRHGIAFPIVTRLYREPVVGELNEQAR